MESLADRALEYYRLFLKSVGEDPGPLNGVFGESTQQAMQILLQKKGYPINGVGLGFGSDSTRALQRWLIDEGFPCSGGADGDWGIVTTISLQNFLNSVKKLQFCPIAVDGTFSAETAMALQGFLTQHGELRIPVDGRFGIQSNQALQAFLKDKGYYKGDVNVQFGTTAIIALQGWLQDSGFACDETGEWDASTITRLQEFLNSLSLETRVITLTCEVLDKTQLEVSCTSISGDALKKLAVCLNDDVGCFRKLLADSLNLSEHQLELVHPDGRILKNNKVTFGDLVGGELVSELLERRLSLVGSRSSTGFLVCRH